MPPAHFQNAANGSKNAGNPVDVERQGTPIQRETESIKIFGGRSMPFFI
jgi:hypothetical protein